jgi:hypothetical protein
MFHFALGLISPHERLVANVMRSIRNQYAHTLAQFDFSYELIISELSKVAINKPFANQKPKLFFTGISINLLGALRTRGDYLTRQRSGLGSAGPVAIYKLSKPKTAGMVAPPAR